MFCCCIWSWSKEFWAFISPLTLVIFDDTLHMTHCDPNTAALNHRLHVYFFLCCSNHSAAASCHRNQPGAELYYFTSPAIYNTNAGSELGFFFFYCFKSPEVLCTLLPHLSVPLFLNSAVWGRLAHQYTIREGRLDKNSAAICLLWISCLEVSTVRVNAHTLTHI